jgi:hypothetical protein
MTKQYPLIQIGEHFYAVDKEAKLLHKDYFYTPIAGSDGKTHIFQVGRYDEQDCEEAKVQYSYQKIVASTDKSIGLPLLEFKEDIQPLASAGYKEFRKSGWDLAKAALYHRGFSDGYKAAKAKKYTEEDIRTAIRRGYEINFENDKGDGSTGYDEKDIQGVLKLLKPSPKSIVIECWGDVEDNDPETEGLTGIINKKLAG